MKNYSWIGAPLNEFQPEIGRCLSNSIHNYYLNLDKYRSNNIEKLLRRSFYYEPITRISKRKIKKLDYYSSIPGYLIDDKFKHEWNAYADDIYVDDYKENTISRWKRKKFILHKFSHL